MNEMLNQLSSCLFLCLFMNPLHQITFTATYQVNAVARTRR